jgi:ribonuclease Z
MNAFKVTFLGTADASFNPFSPTACCLIEVGNTCIMIDAGIGVARQMRLLGLHPPGIDLLLMTHWHPDHFLGLPAVLGYKKKNAKVMLFGPRPPFLARLYLAGLLRAEHVIFGAVSGTFFEDYCGFSLEAVPTEHDIHSVGWLIIERNAGSQRRLVYSGDTRPVPEILDAARGADLLIHEATVPDIPDLRTRDHPHSTPVQAAQLAKAAGVGALALTHIKPENATAGALERARLVFPGLLAPARLDTLYIDRVPLAERVSPFGWGRIRIVTPTSQKA